ncbi:MAG: hypothetical protein KKF85_12335 [Gammaproteobacteria bacterium]|nr:hypothetical protein [Rhodocyclaceae bacterium]MBU3909825.1 hypothetical protein [Gammaproteobacteria bacterium]MBU3988073.1 hypothetical protein [Gammaproteobacteria bacterium]MBU4003596.1 hypothetical protein [Gammaproteobacteria bacterium]MBU4020045.1 hypothetical protein [Gammaproteobacteria bacterium]
MTGVAIVTILVAMGSGWLFRNLLLRVLRERHPDEFAALGQPTSQQLASLSPKLQELHLQFWRYLWGGKVFQIKDGLVTGLAGAALLADAALIVGVVVFLWYAGAAQPQ